jgi:HIRAN domain
MNGIVKLLVAVVAGYAAGGFPPARGAEAVIVVQRSPLAGFRHYAAPEIWRGMAVGERLQLVREPDNPYDANAVRVDWQGVILGYVPRRDNAAVARQMDRGTALEARVVFLHENRNRSVRIEFEIVAPLQNP